MWNRTLFLTLLCACFTMVAEAQILKKVVGNDQYKTVQYKLNDFSKLTMLHGFNVIYKVNPDSAGYVNIYAEENILELISVTAEKNELKLKFNTLRTPEFGVVLVRAYSSGLTDVVNESPGNIEIQSLIEAPQLNFTMTGVGQIKAENTRSGVIEAAVGAGGDILLGGETGMGDFSVQGSGEIRAKNAKAEEVKAVITGSGSIYCNAEKMLTTVLTGSGKIYYQGEPALKSRTVGSGQVIHLEEK